MNQGQDNEMVSTEKKPMNKENSIIIVTGANGRIGDAVLRRFAGRFSTVIGFDRKSPTPPPPDCVYEPVDIASDESVQEGLNTIRKHHGKNIAAVIHLAAYYSFSGERTSKYEEITVRGTERLLRGLHKLDFNVEQFIFSSTMLVHRPAEPGQFITEDWPLEPSWQYPESKVETEKLILRERGNIPAVMLRIAGVYDDLCHSIPLAHQIQRIYEHQITADFFSGETAHGQSFLHMNDLVEAIALTVEHRAQLTPELALLVGEPEVISYDELQHTMSRLLVGKDLETLEVPKPLAKVGAALMGVESLLGKESFIKPWMINHADEHYALDITRARTLLGWEPKRSLRTTLPIMIAALKANPLDWYKKNDLEPSSSLLKSEKAKQHAS